MTPCEEHGHEWQFQDDDCKVFAWLSDNEFCVMEECTKCALVRYMKYKGKHIGSKTSRVPLP